ncbi:MAG: UPF0755 protein [Luteibaculaceae bacterium]|jgi:UPF0755 protein
MDLRKGSMAKGRITKTKAKPKKRSVSSLVFLLVFLAICGGGYVGYRLHQVYQPMVKLASGSYFDFFVYPNSSAEEVLRDLNKTGFILNPAALEWVAEKKGYSSNVKAGKYLIYDNWNANQLINLLRSGNQNPIKLVLNSVRTIEGLAGKLGAKFVGDSIEFLHAFNSAQVAEKFGFSKSTFPTMFLPNTYEMYWNYSVDQVLGRLAKEYKKFWTEGRKAKANQIGLGQSEVSILASIVKAETSRRDEAPKIAGVYMNRLNKGMLLQADPTLVFALGDFKIRRVLNIHKKIDSPYNTYKYKGLPPGPINLPELFYIDAVLNYDRHKYYYFCASEDFSGYSNFAITYQQHLTNARRYQKALSRRGIYK